MINYIQTDINLQHQVLVSNNQMSELAIKRQKLCKEIRRKQVQTFMKIIRERLTFQFLSQTNNVGPKPILSQEILDHLRGQLLSTDYSSQSCVNFLRQINSYQIQSLAKPYLFKYIRHILMNVFDYDNLKKQHQKQIHELSKQICCKIIQYPPLNGQLLIDNCYDQILNIVANDKFDMWQIWPILALIRSQAFFYQSFRDFMICLVSYPQQIDEILTLVLETFRNFTATIEGHNQVKLSINEISQMTDKINILVDKLDLGDQDLRIIVQILDNIFKNNPFSAALYLVLDTHIIQYLLQRIGNWKVNNLNLKTLNKILAFLGVTLSGTSETVLIILSKIPNYISALKNILPISPIFNQIQMPCCEWIHRNDELTQNSLFCFANITSSDDILFFMFSQRMFKIIFYLSTHPNVDIKLEVAIICFNSVIKASSQELQVLCEDNLIFALNNIIRQQYSTDSMFYGLKALRNLLERTNDFPPNNIAWFFNNNRVISECRRYQLPQFIEGLLTFKIQQIAKNAEKCVLLMGDLKSI